MTNATEHEPRRIVIAVDGSEQSFDVIRYVNGIVPPGRARFILFHVRACVPETLEDLELVAELQQKSADIQAWRKRQERMISQFMERVGQVFARSGHPEDFVSVTISECSEDVARDIAAAAREGCDALVLGRRGMSEVKELMMGSIANKLVTHLSGVPVWVVGGHPDPRRILVAMDRSQGAMRALDYVGSLFNGEHPDILLLHVIRGFDVFQPGYERLSDMEEDGDWMEQAREELKKAEKEMESHFEQCIKKLRDRGADVDRISTRVVVGGYSRALTIFGEASEGDYGTIVVGRRGLSRVEEFFMGRVSNKVLQLAKEMAVWVVG